MLLKTQALEEIPQHETNPFVISLEMPAPADTRGGMIVTDLDGDGRMDYLVSAPGLIEARAFSGALL
ncbi:MAG: integrin alpha, partial [Limisphaerales bacterium]